MSIRSHAASFAQLERRRLARPDETGVGRRATWWLRWAPLGRFVAATRKHTVIG